MARPMLRRLAMNLLRTVRSTLPLAIAGLVLLACGGAAEGPAVPETPQAPGVTAPQEEADMTVVDRLASARCDQEQSCSNIGPGAKFVSRSVCVEQVHGGLANDLNAYKCRRGLDSVGVDRCMAAIKSEECNHPFDTLTRYDKCRSGALCLR